MNYTWGRNLRPSKEFSFPSAQRLGIQLYPITILLLNLALLLFLSVTRISQYFQQRPRIVSVDFFF